MTQSEARPLELVVAEDGSIPATQLSLLGLRAGAHLRARRVHLLGIRRRSGGRGPADFPDITWEDFERASDLVTKDASSR